MIERLIESWLDSASERSYQAPFCQMLIADGHKIVHTTRHSPIEFGKDIISLAPDGTAHAFQLKGKPGGRVTSSEFRDIYPQLLQLVVNDLERPEIPHGTKRRNFLVTNGLFEEEAVKSLEEFNRGLPAGYQPLEVLSRGDLLDKALQLGSSLWPSELTSASQLLELLVWNGRAPLPVERVHSLLAATLELRDDSKSPSGDALARHVASAALLTTLLLKPFSEQGNRIAVAQGWILYASYACAAVERWRPKHPKRSIEAIDVACETAFSEIGVLIDEIRENPQSWDRASWLHPIIRRSVWTEVTGWLCLYWLESGRTRRFIPEHDDFIRTFVRAGLQEQIAWGEGAIPYWLFITFFLRGTDATVAPEQHLIQTLSFILGANSHDADPQHALASPYHSLAAILRRTLTSLASEGDEGLSRDSAVGSSFYAKGLMHVVARTGRKKACKDLWAAYTRIAHREYRPAERWQFCLAHSSAGEEVAELLRPTGTWAKLYAEARTSETPEVPALVRERPFLLAAFLLICPWRGLPSVVRYLGDLYYGPPFF